MEFKLNKIDTDIRRKLNEQNSDKKVHQSKEISPTKDTIRDKKNFQNQDSEKKRNNKKNQRNYITIDGTKYGEEIDIRAEKVYDENYKGQILDLKK